MKRALLILGLVACLLAAAGAYRWATAMIDSTFDFRSPLNADPPAPAGPLGEPATRRLVLVLVDGLRYDVSMDEQVMPNLAELRAQGAQAQLQSRPPSYSLPGWTTLVTGAWPDVNGGPAFNPPEDELTPWVQDTLFSAARRAGLRVGVAGYPWYEKLIRPEDRDAAFFSSAEGSAGDRQSVDAALPWLIAGDLQFIYIHLDQVDYASHHEGGPLSQGGLETARRADALLGEIAAQLDLAQDTLVVASDHGHMDRGGHGGHDPVTMQEPWVLVGAGILPGPYGEVEMAAVAPTLAALLGTNLPAAAQGQPRTEMLALDPAVAAKIPDAYANQQAGLYAQYAYTTGGMIQRLDPTDPDAWQKGITALQTARANRERWPRLALFAPLLLALPVALLVRRRPADLWLLVGAFGAVALAWLGYGLLRGAYSFATVDSVSGLILAAVIPAALGLGLAWLGLAYGLGWLRLPRGEAARRTLAFGWVALWLAALPALAFAAWFGPTVTWLLPSIGGLFRALLSQLHVLAFAALTPLLVGISALMQRNTVHR
jgi:hypothetical protein